MGKLTQILTPRRQKKGIHNKLNASHDRLVFLLEGPCICIAPV